MPAHGGKGQWPEPGIWTEEIEPITQHLTKDLQDISKLVKPRTENLGDFLRMADFFFTNLDISPAMLVDQLNGKYNLDHIKSVITIAQETLDGVESWTAASINQSITAIQAKLDTEIHPKDIVRLLRLVLCGKTVTPPLAESMAILGKGRCMRRVGDILRNMEN